jgi:hypothetical protein
VTAPALPTHFSGQSRSSTVRRDDVETPVVRPGRTPQHEHIRRRKQFIRHIQDGLGPADAAARSGHPAARALETLQDLGFTLTVLEPPMDVAA